MDVIRYRTLSGALVSVADAEQVAARCSGCLEAMDTDPRTQLREARRWAADHAGTCAALPPDAADAGTETFAALAEQYARRAAQLLEGDPAVPDVPGAPDPADAARIYLGVAEVYARLAQARPQHHPPVPAARTGEHDPRAVW